MIIPKKYDLNTFSGMSKKQLEEHYKLYLGYIEKLNEINLLSDESKQYVDGNSTYSSLRCLKLGETYAIDGVYLHEMYFENVTGDKEEKKMVSKSLINSIMNDFKNIGNLLDELKQVGLSMRGWCILAYDILNKRLRVFGSDAHDIGAIWSVAIPLVVLDVYEHAYFMDFGTNKKQYIDIFIKNINWRVVSNRFKQIRLI